MIGFLGAERERPLIFRKEEEIRGQYMRKCQWLMAGNLNVISYFMAFKKKKTQDFQL